MKNKLDEQAFDLRSAISQKPVEHLHTLDDDMVLLLKQLVAIPSNTGKTHFMRQYITEFILPQILGVTFHEELGNIYAVKGFPPDADNTYPCVVCHTDTVHEMNYNVRAEVIGDTMYAFDAKEFEQVGTGGDDKVGIFIAIMCLIKFPVIKAVFFRDEENGCQGSGACDIEFFKDCGFVLQADRKGRYDITDSINSIPVLNKEFKDAFATILEKHKRTYVNGAMTDVIALVRKGLEVCCCNISCGYYNPHSKQETINLLHVQECLAFVYDLLEGVGLSRWPFPDRFKKYNDTGTYYGNTFHSRYEYPDGKIGGNIYSGIQPTTGNIYNNNSALDNKDNVYPKSSTGFRTTPKSYCTDCGAFLKNDEQPGLCTKCKTYADAT